MARDPGLSKSLDWFIDGPQPMKWRDVATMVLAVVVPPAVAVWFFGVAGMAAFAASMPAHLASREGGGLVALLATMTTGLAGMVAIGDPVMALLVAGCLSVMTAIASHHQLARPAMRALLTWTLFTAPIIPDDNLPQLFVLYLAGMVWSVSVTVLLGRAGTPAALTAQSRVYSVTFGVVFGIGLVSAVWLGGQLFDDHGFWLPLTALTESERGLWGVLVVNRSSVLERRVVEVLHAEADRAYVRGTLQDGDWVVRTGVQRLVPGQQVAAAAAG